MIEYLAPSGALQYQLRQITLTLTGSDFTKLNSQPITLIGNNNSDYICVVNQFCQYINSNIDTAAFIYVGFEPILASNPSSGSFYFLGNFIQGQRGMYNQSILSYSGPENSLHDHPLVLWSPADDPLCNFVQFIITINYFLIPKVI